MEDWIKTELLEHLETLKDENRRKVKRQQLRAEKANTDESIRQTKEHLRVYQQEIVDLDSAINEIFSL